MRCGILTFHFAYNYGAVLQTYALQKFLNDHDHEVFVLNFVPSNMAEEYSVNPLRYIHHPKKMMRYIVGMPRKMNQYRYFNKFVKRNLHLKPHYRKRYLDGKRLEETDAVLCGSDQIWNDRITGEVTSYYADCPLAHCRKIAYAASFGTDTISEFQKECIRKLLPGFYRISVREKTAQQIIKEFSDIQAAHVLDPVFLQNKNTWMTMAKRSAFMLNESYILYYTLAENRKLKRAAEELSRKEKIKIYTVHPTGVKQEMNGRQLFCVGPYEFLWLVSHAEYVCTSSFHAVAFSVIFGKRMIHDPYSEKDSRVQSLLEMIQAQSCLDQDYTGCAYYDMSKLNFQILQKEIQKSMFFLLDALK